MNQIYIGHVLAVAKQFARKSINTVITSPPYYSLRDYGAVPTVWPEVTFTPVVGLQPITIPAQTVSLGNEPDPWSYVGHLVSVFRALRPALKKDGTLWLNVGDTYAANRGYQVADSMYTDVGNNLYMKSSDYGLKPKNMMTIPWRVAQALQADGWYLRADVIWHKVNAKPASYKDRPTTAHEYIFLLSKEEQYFYNQKAVMEPRSQNSHGGKQPNPGGKDAILEQSSGLTTLGMAPVQLGRAKRNRRTVWVAPEQVIEIIAKTEVIPQELSSFFEPVPQEDLTTVYASRIASYAKAHFATWPEALPEVMVMATCPVDGVVLDPFLGSGTTAAVAKRLGRKWLGVELNQEYADFARERIAGVTTPMFYPDDEDGWKFEQKALF